MRQIFNVREGIKPKDFKLPNRILGKPPIASGPLKGITIDADKLTKEYLKKTMHWSYSTGKPSKARLVKLGGFKKVLADLY
jgi:aldehyde:ferredoxin oxidoreductase